MTNPNSIVRFHSRNGGRGSVYEANMAFQSYRTGTLHGTPVTPVSGMTVSVGGSAVDPLVVIAANPQSYRVALDIVGTANLTITAPSSNSRYTAIVAYTDDLSIASTDTATSGNPSKNGLILVNGTASANPSRPTDTQVRNAITADGAAGSQASYCPIAYILVSAGTTTITSSLITTWWAHRGLMDIFYPVGSYYETSDTSFDPNVSWGGTWVEDTAGRVLVARNTGTFSNVGATGGSEYIQDHTHDLRFNGKTGQRILMSYSSGSSSAFDLSYTSVTGANTGNGVANISAGVVKNTASTATLSVGTAGNLQPYIVIKRWHRTA